MNVILQQQFRDLVNAQLARLGWSRARLAKEMGVDAAYVSIYLNGTRDPGGDVIERFFNAMGMTPRLSLEPLPTPTEKSGKLVDAT